MDPGDPGNLKQALERAKSQGKMEETYRKVKLELTENHPAGSGRSEETRPLVRSPGRSGNPGHPGG